MHKGAIVSGYKHGDAGTYAYYGWIAEHYEPDRFQVLCRPCNIAKSSGPRCPLAHVPVVSGPAGAPASR